MKDIPSESFLGQTARDYDMDINTVIDIYNMSDDTEDFYDQLEFYITVRANHRSKIFKIQDIITMAKIHNCNAKFNSNQSLVVIEPLSVNTKQAELESAVLKLKEYLPAGILIEISEQKENI